jgi:4-amino-4-deoxy-L-arabinose transferase-like glycosyltransferase
MKQDSDHDIAVKTLAFDGLSGHARAAWILIACVFVALAPVLPDVTTFHGDERFYTDAAIRMVQTGDYLIPYFTDGSERFNMPVLTYWILAASYKILGISSFSSRLPFLLAACLTIWLVSRITYSLFRCRQTALLATAITASILLIFTLAVRSTPDILLCLFIAASFYGFLNVIFNRDRTFHNFALAYVGAGLAIQTKGLLGVLAVAYVFLFCLFRKPNAVRCRDLIEWRSMFFGLLVAVLWFVVVHSLYPDEALRVFLDDQVGRRLEKDPSAMLSNFASYTFSFVKYFLPWNLVLFVALAVNRSAIKGFFGQHKEPSLFILGWVCLMLIVFSGAEDPLPRYMLPAYPLLSVLLAALILPILQVKRAERAFSVVSSAILGTGIAVGVALISAGAMINAKIFAGGLFLALASGMLLVLRRTDKIPSFVAITLLIICSFSARSIFVLPGFRSSARERLIQDLVAIQKDGEKIAVMDPDGHLRSEILVFSGGTIAPVRLPEDVPQQNLEAYTRIVIPESLRERFPESEWRLAKYTAADCWWTKEPFRTLLAHKDARKWLERLERTWYVAVRIDGSSSSSLPAAVAP